MTRPTRTNRTAADGPTARRNLVTRNLGMLLVLRQNEAPPADAEWNECLALLAKHDAHLSEVKVLVVTDGGAPSDAQRKRLAQVVAQRPLSVAVVSDSLSFRFPAASVAFFLNIATFGKHQMSGAYDHLAMTEPERRTAEKALAEMAGEVGLPPDRLRSPV